MGASCQGGEVIALVGEMGAGKTTFTQGFAEGLGVTAKITSPTFIIMRSYEVARPPIETFFHVDLYRLEDNAEDEVQNLGLPDFWGKKENVVIIEWAERIKNLLPETTTYITLKVTGDTTRTIETL